MSFLNHIAPALLVPDRGKWSPGLAIIKKNIANRVKHIWYIGGRNGSITHNEELNI